MANTTNFGWQTPDDTSLVKDGAAAMRTLGNAIDTSLVDLKGGTTGQILSKASNTDLDYTWVSPNPGDITAVNAGTGISGGGTSGDVTITNSMATTIDAKGDLIVGTGNDAFGRLAVGSNGQTLVADSSQTTGIRWSDQISAAGKNAVINGGMDIWQRGTSIATAAGYSADRWYAANNANTTYSRQTTSDTTNLPNIQYSLRMQRTAGATSTDGSNILQNFESVNSIPFAGKTVTLSFYARSGANLSGTFNAYLISGTGTDQNDFTGGGFTGKATPISATSISLTSTWQRFSYSGTVAATATQLAIQFNKSNVGTAGANDWAEVTGVQLELGSSATPFSRNGSSIQGELAACQRYYIRTTGDNAYQVQANGGSNSTTQMFGIYNLPVKLRTAPSAVEYANLGAANFGGAVAAVTALVIDLTGTNAINLKATVASGLTANVPGVIINNNNINGYVGFSAEL